MGDKPAKGSRTWRVFFVVGVSVGLLVGNQFFPKSDSIWIIGLYALAKITAGGVAAWVSYRVYKLLKRK